MTTFERELIVQCEALVAVFAAAQVPCSPAPGAFVAFRPALRALRFSSVDQRHIERYIREDPDKYQACCLRLGHGWEMLVVQLEAFLLRDGQRGRHPACTRFAVWYAGVLSAFMTHGYYDPETNHTPPADQQLTALEIREEGRDLLNQLMPGFGDVASGHRPTTEEGRHMFGYLVTDADGTQHFVRDCDLPEDEERDDDGE
jgi:hypothetical protein